MAFANVNVQQIASFDQERVFLERLVAVRRSLFTPAEPTCCHEGFLSLLMLKDHENIMASIRLETHRIFGGLNEDFQKSHLRTAWIFHLELTPLTVASSS